MRIGLLTCDYGDGTSGIRFFRDIDVAINKLENEEEYFMNEEVTEIEVQDDFIPPSGWDN